MLFAQNSGGICLAQQFVDLLLQDQLLLFQQLDIVLIGRRVFVFQLFHFMVQLVVLVKKTAEVTVIGTQVGDLLTVLRNMLGLSQKRIVRRSCLTGWSAAAPSDHSCIELCSWELAICKRSVFY